MQYKSKSQSWEEKKISPYRPAAAKCWAADLAAAAGRTAHLPGPCAAARPPQSAARCSPLRPDRALRSTEGAPTGQISTPLYKGCKDICFFILKIWSLEYEYKYFPYLVALLAALTVREGKLELVRQLPIHLLLLAIVFVELFQIRFAVTEIVFEKSTFEGVSVCAALPLLQLRGDVCFFFQQLRHSFL